MKDFILPEKIYKFFKWICLIVMPALSFGYAKLAPLWNWPYADKIPATIGIVAFVIGCIIGVSSLNYYKDKEEIKEPVEGFIEPPKEEE
jgi:hypothetical protein